MANPAFVARVDFARTSAMVNVFSVARSSERSILKLWVWQATTLPKIDRGDEVLLQNRGFDTGERVLAADTLQRHLVLVFALGRNLSSYLVMKYGKGLRYTLLGHAGLIVMLCHLRRPARVPSLFRALPAVPLCSAATGGKSLFFDMVSLSLSLALPLSCLLFRIASWRRVCQTQAHRSHRSQVHSNNAARIRLWLSLKGAAAQDVVKTKMVKYPDLQSAEFAKINPLKKVPALVRGDGTTVFESAVILSYLEDRYQSLGPPMVPATPEARQEMELLIRVHDLYIASPNCTAPGFSHSQGAMYLSYGWHGAARGMDLPTRAAKMAEIWKQLNWLEAKKQSSSPSPFLVSDQLTLADMTWFPTCVFMEFLLPRFFGWPHLFDPQVTHTAHSHSHSSVMRVRVRVRVRAYARGARARRMAAPGSQDASARDCAGTHAFPASCCVVHGAEAGAGIRERARRHLAILGDNGAAGGALSSFLPCRDQRRPASSCHNLDLPLTLS